MAESIYPLVQEGTNHFAMIVFLQLGVRYRVVADITALPETCVSTLKTDITPDKRS